MCKLESQLTVNATNEYYFSIFNPEVLILIHDSFIAIQRWQLDFECAGIKYNLAGTILFILFFLQNLILIRQRSPQMMATSVLSKIRFSSTSAAFCFQGHKEGLNIFWSSYPFLFTFIKK